MNFQPTIRKVHCVRWPEFRQVMDGTKALGFTPQLFSPILDLDKFLLCITEEGKILQFVARPSERRYYVHDVSGEAPDLFRNGEPLYGLHVRVYHD